VRSEKEIHKKIREIRRANKRRARASPERLDIIAGLEHAQKHGKYGTLHDWETKKVELKKMEGTPYPFHLRYFRRGQYGELIPLAKMDSIAWRLGAYSWALEIRDPVELKIMEAALNKARKLKSKSR
jgi:hypothetical protein